MDKDRIGLRIDPPKPKLEPIKYKTDRSKLEPWIQKLIDSCQHYFNK